MRCILCLHETVTTGAADGYYRMAGKPASTLLHLGPGLANALANLHNLKRARSGVVNIVGEHATYHLRHDALLSSDVQAIAGTMSHWVRTSTLETSIAEDCAEAISVASQPPGQVATLILPADVAWSDAVGLATARPAAFPAQVSDTAIEAAAKAAKRRRPRSHHARHPGIAGRSTASSRQDRRQDRRQAQRGGGECALAARRGPRGDRTDAVPHISRSGDDPGRNPCHPRWRQGPGRGFCLSGKTVPALSTRRRNHHTCRARRRRTGRARKTRRQDRRLQESPRFSTADSARIFPPAPLRRRKSVPSCAICCRSRRLSPMSRSLQAEASSRTRMAPRRMTGFP